MHYIYSFVNKISGISKHGDFSISFCTWMTMHERWRKGRREGWRGRRWRLSGRPRVRYGQKRMWNELLREGRRLSCIQNVFHTQFNTDIHSGISSVLLPYLGGERDGEMFREDIRVCVCVSVLSKAHFSLPLSAMLPWSKNTKQIHN